jgi:hypothetical protein
MDEQVRITGKNLGYLALEKYCPHCLWYLLRFKFHPPFSGFGGAVWGWLEKMQRDTVTHLIDRDSCLPEEFAPLCSIKSRVEFKRHWTSFGYLHKSGVFIYGTPDDIFELSNGELCVIDYKSAKNKGTEDEFFPQYRVQVISYGNIAEFGLELGKIGTAGLMYWEAEVDKFDPSKHFKNGAMFPSWKVGVVPVDVDYKILDPLLKELQSVWNSKMPPEGIMGCKNCTLLARLIVIQKEIDADDQRLLNSGDRHLVDYVYARKYKRNCALREALNSLRTSELLFAQEQDQEPIWDFSNSK